MAQSQGEDASFQGDVDCNNLTVRGEINNSGGGTSTITDLIIAPSQPEPFGPGANMPTGYIANWTQPGLATHTNLVWRGADNQATVVTGIDATGIAEGAVRIFNNATLSPGDAGSVVLLDQSDPRANAGPWASDPDNRICTPLQLPYKCDKQQPLVVQRRRDETDQVRWYVLMGAARKVFLQVQALGLYPHLQVGSPAAPISGVVDNWNPVGEPYQGNPEGLTVDGGDAFAGGREFTFWNVFVDAAGLDVTGLLTSPGSGPPTDYGPIRFIFNQGPGEIRFADHGGTSDVWNQLVLPHARTYRLPAQSGALFIRPYLDEGLGPTVQWRLIGVSNEVFPSVNTTGRTTTRALTLDQQENVVLAAGLNSNVDISDAATVNFIPPAAGSIVDGMIPSEPLVGNEVRLLRNNGLGPMALIGELSSVSGINNRLVLADGRPLVLPPTAYALMQYVPLVGKWYSLQQVVTSRLPAVINAAPFAAAPVIDFAPVDAVTGWNGRYAGTWNVAGAVGTTLDGIDPAPPGAAPYVDGDEILIVNGSSGFIVVHASGLNANPGSRIFLPGGANITLSQFGSFIVRRNAAANAWFVNLNT